MECECLLGTEGLGEEGGPLGASLVTDSLFSVFSHCLSLQQEQWMNVCVGDIIKLENNQFVSVRDKVPL